MKTETELKETWCPYARVAATDSSSGKHIPSSMPTYNRALTVKDGGLHSIGEPQDYAPCLGFACSQCVDGGPVMETQPLDRESSDPMETPPQGEGWVLKNSQISSPHEKMWKRNTGDHYAYCGQNTGEALQQEMFGLADAIYNLNLR